MNKTVSSLFNVCNNRTFQGKGHMINCFLPKATIATNKTMWLLWKNHKKHLFKKEGFLMFFWPFVEQFSHLFKVQGFLKKIFFRVPLGPETLKFLRKIDWKVYFWKTLLNVVREITDLLTQFVSTQKNAKV